MLRFPDTFGVIFGAGMTQIRSARTDGRVGALRRPDAAARRPYRCFNTHWFWETYKRCHQQRSENTQPLWLDSIRLFRPAVLHSVSKCSVQLLK